MTSSVRTRPVARMQCITLGLTVALACYSYASHIVNFHRRECAVDGIAAVGPQRQTTTTTTTTYGQKPPPMENDGLNWITAKPNKVRRMGYEDAWLMQWKYRHYRPNLGPRCVHTKDYSPFQDDLMCTIPGYVPARLFVTPPEVRSRNESLPPHPDGSISRVIFVSWLDRRLGKAMFTSLMTLIHHNPEYEFIFFDDEDVDRFFCETAREEWAIPILSRINAGAMRADVWRLLIMQRYGGVYVDSDISALGRLPIAPGDTAVSGVGCWGHIPTGVPGSNDTLRGVLEHWAMAFMPNHPFINAAVSAMKNNLLHPDYLLRSDTPEAASEGSVTMRLTGPAMYQRALHDVLIRSKCEYVDSSFCDALWAPEDHCDDMQTFRAYFPGGERFFKRVNLNDTVTHKVFIDATVWDGEEAVLRKTWDYDDSSLRITNTTDPTFCDAEAIHIRASRREIVFKGTTI
ncbi:hypothetical protein ACHAXA_001047 [Cyclostephanos tholiformis]|uniref:Glycosyltransferase family 32 protein n=1 Tax=Cyclostephanos tholiformis TaxID=382380 RepID=A0ABD3RCY9_9STRA